MEPSKLLEYRLKEYASYSYMPADVKRKVMKSLLAEQGYLCAYCMSRIDLKDEKYRATIEHCVPQFASSEKERLDYKNMVAVCLGNRDAHSNSDKSCDAKRGNLPLEQQFFKKINIFDERTLIKIQYHSDGTIYSEDTDIDNDLNERLNLNCKARQLKQCRQGVLNSFIKCISKKYEGKPIPTEQLEKLLSHYTSNSDKKVPYCGIIISWLTKKLHNNNT